MNIRLTLYQKYKIFKALPGGGLGLWLALIGSLICVPVFASSPSLFFSPAVVMFLIWPAIGTYIMIPSVKYFPKVITAIENGECVEAKLLETALTDTSFGGKPLRRLKFEFEYWGQPYTHISKIVGHQSNVKTHYLMVETQKPHNAVYLELLPREIRLKILNSQHLLKSDQ